VPCGIVTVHPRMGSALTSCPVHRFKRVQIVLSQSLGKWHCHEEESKHFTKIRSYNKQFFKINIICLKNFQVNF
jgi:hypothetical protein